MIFEPAPAEQVELTLDGGPAKTWSEFEQVVQASQPHLAGVEIAELTEHDGRQEVSLLAGKIGVPVERVVSLVVAHKLARRTGLTPGGPLWTDQERPAARPQRAARDRSGGAQAGTRGLS